MPCSLAWGSGEGGELGAGPGQPRTRSKGRRARDVCAGICSARCRCSLTWDNGLILQLRLPTSEKVCVERR